ncbi:hypothetical protein BG015_007449 [Linnemannia schmuckeri]|uniref:Uncharacterized protein n=1 Tax=Linnemannia schmuckeri TaxID=64567 RepID=A0A9P5S158_9FUNG|nr:hypothetical protein BG015_007449 [Linnemannia schmuckeri]
MTKRLSKASKAEKYFMDVELESRKRKQRTQEGDFEDQKQETLYKKSKTASVHLTTASSTAPIASTTTTSETFTVTAAATAITTAPSPTIITNETSPRDAGYKESTSIKGITLVATNKPSSRTLHSQKITSVYHTPRPAASLKRCREEYQQEEEEKETKDFSQDSRKKGKINAQDYRDSLSFSASPSSSSSASSPTASTPGRSPILAATHPLRSAPSQSLSIKLGFPSRRKTTTTAASPSSSSSSTSTHTFPASPISHSARPKASKNGHCDWQVKVLEREKKFILCIKPNNTAGEAPMGQEKRDKRLNDHNRASGEMAQDDMVQVIPAKNERHKKKTTLRAGKSSIVIERRIEKESKHMPTSTWQANERNHSDAGESGNGENGTQGTDLSTAQQMDQSDSATKVYECTHPQHSQTHSMSIADDYNRSKAMLVDYYNTHSGVSDSSGDNPHISAFYSHYRESWLDAPNSETVGNIYSRSSSSLPYPLLVCGTQPITRNSNNRAEPPQPALSFIHTSQESNRLPYRHHSIYESNSGIASDGKKDKGNIEVINTLDTQNSAGLSFTYYGKSLKTDMLIHGSDSNNNTPTYSRFSDLNNTAINNNGNPNFNDEDDDNIIAAATALATLADSVSTLPRTSSNVNGVFQTPFLDKNNYGSHDQLSPVHITQDVSHAWKRADRTSRPLDAVNINISNINYNGHNSDNDTNGYVYGSGLNTVQDNRHRRGHRHYLL